MSTPTEERRGKREEEVREVGRGGTYRTLDEQTETGRLSPAEERFERRRRTVGLFLGPIAFAVVLLVPLGLEANQHRLAAILALVVVWWVTEAIPIPVTALLAVGLVAEATPPPPEGDAATDVVFSAFADDTVFLFIGSFIIARRWWSTACTEGWPTACSIALGVMAVVGRMVTRQLDDGAVREGPGWRDAE